MIFTFLIQFVLLMIAAFFSVFPTATVASIPLIGPALAAMLILVVGYWNSFEQTLPYVVIDWQLLLLVVIPFEIFMLVLKFFLGHRAPGHQK